MLFQIRVVALRLLLAVFTASFHTSLFAESVPPAGEPRELVFLTWAEYMDPDVITEFEEKFNAKVKFSYFEADDDRTERLVRAQARGFDVVLTSGDSVRDYASIGWLEPLGPEQIPNLKYYDKRWHTAFEHAEQHAVPLFWGTLGIGYRRDLVEAPITSMMQLFRPGDALRNKVLMVESARDTIGFALLALGYSTNSTDAQQLAEAEALLMAQKPFVRDYSYVVMTEESELVTGDIPVAMLYNGDAVYLQEMEPNVSFVVPEEGCILWVDYFTVLQSSPNKALAFQFINFLSEPDIAARLAEYLGYATPNAAALKILPKEFLQNQITFPDAESISRCEYNEELPPRVMKKRSAIFSRVIESND